MNEEPTRTGGRAPAATGDLQDKPLPELLKQLSDQTATLVRQEMELAKAEMTAKGKQLGIGAGAFGGAGLFGVFAFGALTACFILALGLAVAGWLAALIVAVVYAAIARRRTQSGADPGRHRRHARAARRDRRRRRREGGHQGPGSGPGHRVQADRPDQEGRPARQGQEQEPGFGRRGSAEAQGHGPGEAAAVRRRRRPARGIPARATSRRVTERLVTP